MCIFNGVFPIIVAFDILYIQKGVRVITTDKLTEVLDGKSGRVKRA